MMETGIRKLDEMLGGGIRKGSNILLIGPPLSRKEVILNHIIYHGAVKNESAIISVNTNEPGIRFLEWFEENRLVLPQSRIGIIDCISGMLGRKVDESENIKIVEKPYDLAEIGIKINKFYEKFFMNNNIQKIQLNINSISTLLMYSDIKSIFRFLHIFTGRIKTSGGLGVYVIEKGIHDVQAIASLNQLFDGVIEIKTEDDRNFMRATGVLLKPTPWLEYEIDMAKVRIKNSLY